MKEVEGNNCGNGYEYIEAAILINIKEMVFDTADCCSSKGHGKC